MKFTDTSLTIDLSGVFSDPEGRALTTSLYTAGKTSSPGIITSYSEGVLTLSATYSDAKTYNLELRSYDNIT